MLDTNDVNYIRRLIASVITDLITGAITLDDIDANTIETRHLYHKDTFGLIGTVLTSASTYTTRLLRSTKTAVPHIAKNDVFTYRAQYNHDKKLLVNADDFHIHLIPVGAVTAGQVINLDWKYGWIKAGDKFPNVLPNSGTTPITLTATNQYDLIIKTLITDLAFPISESYSSELFVEVTRRNDGTDTYPGEFALLDGDSHYPTTHFGSFNTVND